MNLKIYIYILYIYVCMLSHVQLFVIPWTVAHQAPLSKEFSREEYQSGSTFPAPGNLPDPGSEPLSPMSPVKAGRFFTTLPPRKPVCVCVCVCVYNWITLLYTWNIVNQLYFNKKKLVDRFNSNLDISEKVISKQFDLQNS